MEASAKMTLMRFSDTNLTVSASDEDIRGRQVLDASGEGIGHVIDLLIDEEHKKVRFLEVASGGFLGLGEAKVVLPVDAISRVDSKHVHVDQTREHIANAPAYDPTLVAESYYGDVYNHYGYSPFWGMGYAYPVFPVIPDSFPTPGTVQDER